MVTLNKEIVNLLQISIEKTGKHKILYCSYIPIIKGINNDTSNEFLIDCLYKKYLLNLDKFKSNLLTLKFKGNVHPNLIDYLLSTIDIIINDKLPLLDSNLEEKVSTQKNLIQRLQLDLQKTTEELRECEKGRLELQEEIDLIENNYEAIISYLKKINHHEF